jgi:Ser/Thr protein kinase RdoA (MazF antagonist)
MSDLINILGQWWSDAAVATVTPFTSAGSFSGARIWRVERHGEAFALRQWPDVMPAKQLRSIHAFLAYLTSADVTFVAAPIAARAGGTFVTDGWFHWELAPWLSGVADYWHDPRPTKLTAAMQALATVHLVAASLGHSVLEAYAASGYKLDPLIARRMTNSMSLQKRDTRIRNLVHGGLGELAASGLTNATASESELHRTAVRLLQRTAPKAMSVADFWANALLPLQWRIGDVWHDHILFTGERVTGIVDFGAASVDAPAGDVARLLGSLVGDDRPRWRQGLAAYESVRPLSELERESLTFFDESGTIISTANWLSWLSSKTPVVTNRPAAINRLRRLVARLQVLAAAE